MQKAGKLDLSISRLRDTELAAHRAGDARHAVGVATGVNPSFASIACETPETVP